MTQPAAGSARAIWRDYNVDGVPVSGKSKPQKNAIRNWGSQVEMQLAALDAAQIAASIVRGSWAALSAVVGTQAGQRAEVFGDAGTHTDPVTSAIGVANSGVYAWSASPAGWQWVSANSLAAETAARIAADGAEATARQAADAALSNSLAAETQARIASIANESAARAASIGAEALARAAADTAETSARVAAFTALQAQIAAVTGGQIFDGAWNASTNSPTLTSGVGSPGHYRIVQVAGSTSIDGQSTWNVGDWIVFSGTTGKWVRIPFQQITLPWVTPETYGAVGDGVTNDTAALTAAFAASASSKLPVLLHGGAIYLISSTINISSNQTIISHGAKIKTASTTMTMLSAVNVNYWQILGRLYLEGPGITPIDQPGATNADAGYMVGANFSGDGGATYGGYFTCGLLISECVFALVEGVHCANMPGVGILRGGGAYVAPRGNKIKIVNCSAISCWIGYAESANSSTANLANEYGTIIGLSATWCQLGMAICPGNNMYVGGGVVDNYDGAWMDPGANSTHGVFVGFHFNHSRRYNIAISNQSAGAHFVGCTCGGDNASQGVIHISNSWGIMWIGGTYEASVYMDGALSSFFIFGAYFNKDYDIVFSGTNPQGIYKFNNMTNGGPASWNDPAWDYVFATLSTNIPLTSGVRRQVAFDVVKVNARRSYNNTTGNFTAYMARPHIISGAMRVTGTTINWAVAIISVNGVDVMFQPLGAVSTSYVGAFQFEQWLAIGDVVTVTIQANGSSDIELTSLAANLSIKAN